MARKRKRTRTSRTDSPVSRARYAYPEVSPEAMALHASSVADVRARRGPTTQARPWYLLAGACSPVGHTGPQPVAKVWTTLTRLDHFNGRASGLYLKRPPIETAPGVCPGLCEASPDGSARYTAEDLRVGDA